MTQREKRLGIMAGVIFGSMILYSGAMRLLVDPVRTLDANISSLRRQYAKATSANMTRGPMAREIREFTRRCFGPAAAIDQVQGTVEQHLVELLDRSGLTYDRLRIANRGDGRDAFEWVARSVVARGRLDQVVNFLYLLQEQPQPHLVQGLKIEPQRGSMIVQLSFQYQTPLPKALAYEKKKSLKDVKLAGYAPLDIEAISFQPPQTAGQLNSPQRALYDVIANRDPLRRYQPAPRVVRQDPPPRKDPPARREDPPQQPPPSSPSPSSRYKLTGLSAFGGQPRILIEDLGSPEKTVLKVGDSFDGGKIVMVDYRLLPDPENPSLKTFSRIILKKGPDYWALESGDTFDKKRLLKDEQLPPGLMEDTSSSAPAKRKPRNPKP
jgi:hypothetical protein